METQQDYLFAKALSDGRYYTIEKIEPLGEAGSGTPTCYDIYVNGIPVPSEYFSADGTLLRQLEFRMKAKT